MDYKTEAMDWEAEMEKSFQDMLKDLQFDGGRVFKPFRRQLETFRAKKVEMLAQADPKALLEKLYKEYEVQCGPGDFKEGKRLTKIMSLRQCLRTRRTRKASRTGMATRPPFTARFAVRRSAQSPYG
jgi:hypothetical protein